VGALEEDFRRAAAAHPDRLAFHGRVERSRLAELMFESDAIVNPHVSISAMDDGVFPFKVCEALASGALLISTRLPPIDIDLTGAVMAFDGSPAGLAEALIDVPRRYAENRQAIDRARQEVVARYSEDAVLRGLRDAMDAGFTKRRGPAAPPSPAREPRARAS
jgi:glycosyltransferase involved in cell wall biosynthesis